MDTIAAVPHFWSQNASSNALDEFEASRVCLGEPSRAGLASEARASHGTGLTV